MVRRNWGPVRPTTGKVAPPSRLRLTPVLFNSQTAFGSRGSTVRPPSPAAANASAVHVAPPSVLFWRRLLPATYNVSGAEGASAKVDTMNWPSEPLGSGMESFFHVAPASV